jgi:TRAP-type C4-dicarboxylate transport system substrate-binding protein
MEAYYKKGGNKPLAVTYYGVRHTTANKPIVKPEDMKGLKLRVPDAPLYVMYPKVVGANATPIAFAEVYLALQNKTVDAQENPLPTIEAKKFYEVQSHINLTGHITEMLLTIVSGQLWSKLSDADKKSFEAIFREAAAKAPGRSPRKPQDQEAASRAQGRVVDIWLGGRWGGDRIHVTDSYI